jgi:Cu/Ag efflux protein CusF
VKHLRQSAAIATLALILTSVCWGQSAKDKKAHIFHGKVEAVDPTSSSLKVNGEKVEGWMDAMTMNYKVDDAAVLKKVKAGDQIMATVYDGDLVLHKVEVILSAGNDSKTKK